MEIAYLFLADYADTPGNGKTYASGLGWSMLVKPSPDEPLHHAFFVCLGIDLEPVDGTREFPFTIAVQDPDGKPLALVEGVFGVQADQYVPEALTPRMPLSLPLQCSFERLGPHAVVVEIDGEPVTRSRFVVVPAPTG